MMMILVYANPRREFKTELWNHLMRIEKTVEDIDSSLEISMILPMRKKRKWAAIDYLIITYANFL